MDIAGSRLPKTGRGDAAIVNLSSVGDEVGGFIFRPARYAQAMVIEASRA
jgi:hypothetical protein